MSLFIVLSRFYIGFKNFEVSGKYLKCRSAFTILQVWDWKWSPPKTYSPEFSAASNFWIIKFTNENLCTKFQVFFFFLQKWEYTQKHKITRTAGRDHHPEKFFKNYKISLVKKFRFSNSTKMFWKLDNISEIITIITRWIYHHSGPDSLTRMELHKSNQRNINSVT